MSINRSLNHHIEFMVMGTKLCPIKKPNKLGHPGFTHSGMDEPRCKESGVKNAQEKNPHPHGGLLGGSSKLASG